MKHAIVLSGHTAALGIVRSLGRLGVPVIVVHYGDHDFAGRSRFVQTSLRAPHPELEEEEFISFLLECGAKYPGAALFPATDETVVAVSRHRQVLEQCFKVAATDWDVTCRFIDKQYTYSIAEQCGVAAPRTLVPRTLEEARSGALKIGFPCLIKPCQVHLFSDRFGKKMLRVETIMQLEEAFTMSTQAGIEVLLQELIPGDDTHVVNYNSYMWEGDALAEFTAIHIRNGPPWFGPPRVVISRHVPEVIEPGRRILQAMGFSGYSCIEFKRDARDGTYKVLDVNGRHNLSTLLAVRCGINFPWLHYQHLTEGVLPRVSEFQDDIYWIDIFRDVGYTWKFRSQEHLSVRDYLRPYIQPHVFAIFDRTDLLPFLRRATTYKTKK